MRAAGGVRRAARRDGRRGREPAGGAQARAAPLARAARPLARWPPPQAAPRRAPASQWGTAAAEPPAWARAAALLGRPAATAAAVGALALAALALQRVGGRHHEAAPPAAAAIASTAGLDAAAAARLVRGYQEAKWRALGRDWDTSALGNVACGAALSHLRGASDQYASRGWFQRFRLRALAVGGVAHLGPGDARVDASVSEASSVYGVDGRCGDSVTSDYDVVYRMKRGGDGRWRVANFKVVGKEPAGGWLARLFGVGGQ